MSVIADSNSGNIIIQPDEIKDTKKLFCCYCIPIVLGIKITCIYELYHIFTQYQLITFGFAFYKVERISKQFLILYQVFACLLFLLMVMCEYQFIRWWRNPKPLKNISGLLSGMSAAIAYDFFAMIMIFILFFTAVNHKIGQMMHFFYDGAPPFLLEIVIQIFIKS